MNNQLTLYGDSCTMRYIGIHGNRNQYTPIITLNNWVVRPTRRLMVIHLLILDDVINTKPTLSTSINNQLFYQDMTNKSNKCSGFPCEYIGTSLYRTL